MPSWLVVHGQIVRLHIKWFLDRRWSRLAPVMNAGISRVGTIITVTGTMLLWSNSFERTTAAIKQQLAKLGVVLEPGWFDAGTQLKIVYYGGIVLLVAWIIYKVRCPAIVQRKPIADEYIVEQAQVKDQIALHQAEARVGPCLPNPDRWSTSAPSNVGRKWTPTELLSAVRTPERQENQSALFRAWHMADDVQRPISFCLCTAMTVGGFIATALPSLEVFVNVTKRLLH